ncbi:TSUP family transporter [Desulfosporosinus meridiei]|uniref:Probable membrane transporter protein n=1 Tax=Desulfosporosinus meridiei (strain ATCC BAA-275 / DSM 13257 / KCTC 12902 / NCIMB 13706 / S10) TaxID=768704 RepID=J7IRT7_DESMD|nr:TSUP family transporter [Desulfosporosinus meridiei]AFQ44597.1 putative permease [Desulfosporosinus meridiei DSM 13257]
MFFDLTIICTLGFFAAMVDAIAGGGGLISLPALLMVGIPPHLALGTNKFSASLASLNSSITFARSGKVHFPLVKWQIPFTLFGAALGAWSVLRVSSDFLNKAVLVLILVVGIYTFVHKNLGMENRFKGLNPFNTIIGCLFAFALGFYDGFFGPGTGSFLIFSFIALFGFDFVIASANSKVLNFTSNIASLFLFAWNGKVLYSYGVPMAVFMILGSYVGTRLAIHRGAALVKPLFIIMSLLVAAKLILQYI